MESSVPLMCLEGLSGYETQPVSVYPIPVPDIYGYVTNRPQILWLETTVSWFS